MATLDPRALAALAFHRTTSTGLVKVSEGLVVMDLRAIIRPPDLAQQLGEILLPPLRRPSIASLGMVAASMGNQVSPLQSIPPVPPPLKAMVNSSPNIHHQQLKQVLLNR